MDRQVKIQAGGTGEPFQQQINTEGLRATGTYLSFCGVCNRNKT